MRIAALVLLCWFVRPCAAAPPFVYETPGEFLVSGDFNGDGIADVLIVDITTGNTRLGYSDGNGNLTWSAPMATGVPNPTGCAVGLFLKTGWDAVALTSPTLNAVNLVDLSATNTVGAPVVVTPPGLGTHTIVPLANPFGGAPPAYNYLLTASSDNSGGTELLDLMNINAGAGSETGQYDESGPFDRGNALQLTSTPATIPTLAAGLVRGTNDTLDIWQFTNAPAVALSYSNLPSGSDYTFGHFNGEPLPRFIFYLPGGTNLTIVQLLQTNGVLAFGTPLETNCAEPIEGIFYVDSGTDGSAMIQFTNGVGAMTLPGGVPTFAAVYSSGAAAGNVFTGVVPLGGGQFALLDAPPGSPASGHAQVVRFSGGNYTQLSSGNLPATTAPNTRANVWLFQTEPFVHRQPGFIASFNSPDWSDGVSGLPGSFAVKLETDNGTSGGLGSAITKSLGTPPTGSLYGLANQYSGVISLFSYGGPQPAQPVTVTISPPPGLYDGSIPIKFSTLNSSDQVYYHVGSADTWHHYSTSFILTNDNAIQFYGTNAAQPLRSQLQSATYTLGKNNQLALQGNSGNGAGGTNGSSTNSPTQPNGTPGLVLSSSVGTLFYGRRSTSNNGTIWAINLDGSDDTYITTGVRPRASKDGLWLAFLREGDPFNNQGNLWIRNVQSGLEQRILVNTNVIVGYDWEPDDSGLVVDYGCGVQRLGTNGVLSLLFATDCHGEAPVLNPKSGLIAFHDLYANPAVASATGIYVANANGLSTQLIVSNVVGAAWLEWSPDGQLLCFADSNHLGALDDGTNLWVVAPDGSGLNRICDFTGTDNRFPHGAIWSPDSGSLVGAATLYETNGIWIIPLNAERTDCGGGAILLPTTPGDAIDFAGSIVLETGGPIITVQPAGIVAQVGQPANVSVTAIGAPPLHYEWIKDGVLLPNLTNSTLSFASFQLTNAGIYQVLVTNQFGLAISLPVRLSLLNAPFRGWGDNSYGELGDNGSESGYPYLEFGAYGPTTNSPQLLESNVVTAATGGAFSMFVTASGSLFSVGLDFNGQLGLGAWSFLASELGPDVYYDIKNQPGLVMNNVVSVAGGGSHSLVLTADGNLWAMGANYSGQLGLGLWYIPAGIDTNFVYYGPTNPPLEVDVPLLVAGNVVEIAAGESHSLFVKADGTLWATGDNTYGELGDGTTTSTIAPIQVAKNVVAISAGGGHSAFITADRRLWVMGRNNDGELGDGTFNPSVLSPEVVASNVVAVAAGDSTTLFVTTGGALWGMGLDTGNELGAVMPLPYPYNGNFVNYPIPIATNVVSVTANFWFSMFVTGDGALWGMGNPNNVLDLTLIEGGIPNPRFPTLVEGGGWMVASLAKGPESFRTCLAVMGRLPTLAPLTNLTVIPGQSYQFTASYTNGDGPTTLQWQFNGANIGGATNATYGGENASPAVAGLYTIVASGTYGNARTNVNLYINEAPTILNQPVSSAVAAGQAVRATVGANVTSPLTYQWFKDGARLAGQTNSALSFASFQFTNSGAYRVAISNLAGMALSVPALLTVSNAPLRGWGDNRDGQLGIGTVSYTNLPVVVASNVVVVADGDDHSLFVKADGTLWAMGFNESGELGITTASQTNQPVDVASNAVAVAAGQSHSLFLKADGSLWGMGNNYYGALGLGPIIYATNRPACLATNVAAIAAGESHSLFVKADTTLWAMGENTDGQLGLAGVSFVNTPVMVASNVVAVAAGGNHSLFMTADGTLWAMGNNDDGQLGNGTYVSNNVPAPLAEDVVTFAAGFENTFFVKADGTLWGVGYGGDGELGSAGPVYATNRPVMIATNVTAVAGGFYNSYYVTADGAIWALGNGGSGGLGNGGYLETSLPVLVSGGGLVTASVASGGLASCFLAVAGALPVVTLLTNQTVTPDQPFSFTALITGGDGPFTYQWELNGTNLTDATNATYDVSGANATNAGTYTIVVTGAYGSSSASAMLNINYALVITGQPTGGAVVAGQPASASVTALSFVTPVTYEWMKDGVLLPNETNATVSFASFQLTNSGAYQVVISNQAGIAISRPALLGVTDAPLRAWGENGFGQLGAGTTANSLLPELIASNAVTEAVGGGHSLYVTADGTLWAMGENNAGQLGNGTTANTNRPVAVAANVVAAAAGYEHSLYVTKDGTLWAMGYNNAGQLGNGATVNTNRPVTVATNVVAVAAGYEHSLYVTANGTLWAMGGNANGQLGDGATVNTNRPVAIATNVVTAAAGYGHSVYVTADGNLWAMGYNGFGQLGNGTMLDTNRPVNVAGGVVAAAAGGYHSLYVTADGTLWGTGYNEDGALGDGTGADTNRPIMIATNVIGASAGLSNSMYMTGDGKLWAMGGNKFGQLGIGTTNNALAPVLVNGGGLVPATLAKGGTASQSLAVAGALPVVTTLTNQIVRLGQPFNFAAVVTGGDGPFSYQWQFSGTDLADATNATYTGFAAVAGTYTVVVMGALGGTSASASLNVKFVPTIAGQPTGSVVGLGQAASVSVNAISLITPVTYEWIKDGGLLPGATNSALSFPSFQLTNSGAYQVVVSNADGLAISTPALLTVSNAPLRGWGNDQYGQLGGGGTTFDQPLPEMTAENVVTVAAGGLHSLYVTADNNLWAMGYNGYGELGSGTFNSAYQPVLVAADVVAVAAGDLHSLYVTADGNLWAMGYNNSGQLGNGTVNSVNQPVMVAANVVAVAAGFEHSLYVTADGSLWAMGGNSSGQLGAGILSYADRPVLVAGNVVMVAAGYEHSLYVTADGKLWGMGYNGDGELGDGSYTSTNRPVGIASNVVAAAGGGGQSLYVTADGKLWGTGNNAEGQLGDGSYNSINQPEVVATGVVAVTAGDAHSLYVTADGSLWAMGQNYYGQLGDGGSEYSTNLPVRVNEGDMVAASLAKGPNASQCLAVAGAAPLVTSLPDQTVYIGQPFYLNPTFELGGDFPDTYQWQLDGTNISGAINAYYSVSAATTNDAGVYTLTVTGPFNSTSNANASATLTVEVQPPPPTPPVITQQPISGSVVSGQPASVSVTASGTAPLTYEWIKDGVLLPHATNSTLRFASFQLTNNGAYQVVVSNALGLVISVPALISFTNAPLRVWGDNAYGQLGDGSSQNVTLPEEIAGSVAAMAAGGQFSLYVTADRNLWAMGYDVDGELGSGGGLNQYQPVMVATNVVAVAAGEAHSLYLTADGTLWAMGQDGYGQLGDGGSSAQVRPEIVATNVVAVAAGGYHSLFLTAGGGLWAMGDNAEGQLGDGTTNNAYEPEMVATNVVMIAAGELHSLFVTADGTLRAMGDNADGELGDGGSELSTNLPVVVATNVVAVAAGGYPSSYGVGGYHSLFVTADGTLRAMGYNGDGELGDGGQELSTNRPVEVTGNVVAVAAGGAHSLYVTGDGNLWAMGDNTFGELGNYGGGSTQPEQVNGGGMVAASLARGEGAFHALSVAGMVPQVSFNDAIVTNGQSFTFTTTVNGGDGPFTYQWQYDYVDIAGATNDSYYGTDATSLGRNGYIFSAYTVVVTGAFGSITGYAYWFFLPPPYVSQQPASTVAGVGQAASLSVIGYSWGEPMTYEWIKDGVLLPTQTNSTINFTSFQLTNSGTYQAVIFDSAGLTLSRPALMGVSNAPLRAWGANGDGQLGDGTLESASLPEKVAANVVAAAAGANHSLYVTADGKLWTTGGNGVGQLGDGTLNNADRPEVVAGNVVATAAGGDHSLYLTADGNLWAMGANASGQLGDGTLNNTNRPEIVGNNVVIVAAGGGHSLFITEDGNLWATGGNNSGQLGDGTLNSTSQPEVVATNVVAAAAGGRHSLYVTADGKLWAMGQNAHGQLGDGMTINAVLPVNVAANVVAVTAGDSHSLYLTSDGSLWAMGGNNSGQLGDGTTSDASHPVMIATGVVGAAAGASNSFYVAADGRLWAMGGNSQDQLGDGTQNNSSRPTLVNRGGLIAASLARGPETSHGLAVAGAIPVIDALANQTVNPGQAYDFSAVVTAGDGPFDYQWELNSVDIANATNATYTVANASSANTGSYTIVVTGAYASASASATLTASLRPIIIAFSQQNNFGGTGKVLTITVNIVQSYEVLVSTDLKTWSSLGSFSADGLGRLILTDPSATTATRFYRLECL